MKIIQAARVWVSLSLNQKEIKHPPHLKLIHSPYFTSDACSWSVSAITLFHYCSISLPWQSVSYIAISRVLSLSQFFFSIFSICHPLSLCFCVSDSAVESQWGWAKATSQSTANTTVIACCPPRPTGVSLQKNTHTQQRNGSQREKERCDYVNQNVRKKAAKKEKKET